jgi:uncharacterized protein
MKLQPDSTDVQAITAYGADWVAINGERLNHSVLISSRGLRRPWPPGRFEDLQAEHFAPLAELGVELIVFGSGAKLRFVPPAWLGALMQARVGFETMDTQAACRTYNILAGEGRPVAAALLLEAP